MARPLHIRVDEGDCRGAGECVLRAPGTFALGDDQHAKVIDPAGDAEPVVLAAARSCPHFAISVFRGEERLV